MTESIARGLLDSPTVKTCVAQIGGQELCISTGDLARQANGSVLVQLGDTVVLGAVTLAKPLYEDGDFLPLLVDFEERFYAAGKIKGSRFIKREGRPSEEATLTARFIDRSLRPLFPENMINNIQVVLTVLSYDGENDADVPAMIAASAALSLSDIPWDGPLGAVRVGRINDQFVINPSVSEREQSTLDLIVAGTGDRVVMIEAGANEVPEDIMIDAIEEAQRALAKIVPVITELQQQSGKAKVAPTLMKTDPERDARFHEIARPVLAEKLEAARTKDDFKLAERAAVEAVVATLTDEEKLTISEGVIKNAVHELHGIYARERVLKDSWREGGRALDQVRPLTVRAGVLPRTHGSSVFQRGETQILNAVTLGGPSDVQLIDTMQLEAKKRYIHYYNFPSFSVGEVKPNRGPGRREIGHGNLAERAMLPVLPAKEDWPYTMLLVSEVLESNGSSSMGSVCGSSLSLMDAGVPIKKAVGGIAMGLVSDGTTFRVLTDIAGIEDEKGDMDFKVAGTRDGITALQMDVKVLGLTREILSAALAQAKQARLHILDAMDAVISAPRADLSPYAPRIFTMRIPVEKIGDLIGPKGKHINEIIESTGVEIDIDDDGLVSITSNDGQAMEKAKEWVHNLTREIKAGERFEGRVTRIMDFGAFVELVPNVEGMVHISQFRDERVEDIHDVTKVGDIIPVLVIEIDSMGRINLSHKAALPGGNADVAGGMGRGGRPERRGGGGHRGSGPGSFRGPRPPR
ncbi:MAG: polyribonucleotide nucleotidyltransferase [Candidatus Andersenbacteria bacterium]